ncbi:MAG: hypothetical protein QOG64_2570 [Acidimicrobiaceae bacterium]|nr:hypothetical protein [Acidimicrobiaceae bacterium]
MTAPNLYLAASVIGLLFTLNALKPVPFEPTSVFAFFAGWLTSELPIHHFLWQLVATAIFIGSGALSATAGWIGLGITVVSWCGLALLVVRAQRAEGVLEQALVEGLGPDYRRRMAPELAAEQGAALAWRRLILPFRLRDPNVEKLKDIPYVDDGTKAHRLDVYRNRSHPRGRPVFVYVHGGGWVIGDKREQGIPLLLHLAAHGWVCFTDNYRLSPKATFPEHLIDVKQAVAWVKEHCAEHGGDPGYVVIGGGSAGGHLASLLALTPDRPEYQPGFEDADTSVDACVPLYGVYDFTNRDGLLGDGMERFLLAKKVMKVPIATHREAYEKASPMDQVSDGAPAFFAAHGANDSLVPVAEARHFVALLRDASCQPVLYAELPGAQHAFETFRSVRTAHLVDAVARFLAVVYADSRRTAPAAARPQ